MMERKLQITGKGNLSVAPDMIVLSFKAEAHEWEYEKDFELDDIDVTETITITWRIE